jgi:hypothetical protein
MSSPSSYQPFLIGQFKTGQFSYLQPWQSPHDAFEPLVNAYAYRGGINKRQGYQQCGFTGLLRYQNNEVAGTGDGTNTYTLNLTHFPVDISTVTVTAIIAGVKKTMTDVPGVYPAGTFTGTLNSASTINYFTGVITMVASGNVTAGTPIMVQYTFTNSLTAENIGTGDGTTLTFNGTLGSIPIVPLSVNITTTTLAGATIIKDDGNGNLVSSLVSAGSFINYTTGVWNLIFTSAVTNATLIVANYIQVGDGSPIMGLNYFENETTGAEVMTVEDQRRMAIFNTGTKLFDPIQTFDQDFFTVNSGVAITSGSLTLPFINIAPFSISISDGTNTITDIPGAYPAGTFTTSATLNNANNSTINYSTGAITITFAAYGAPAVPVILHIHASLQGDYFTGGDNDFFKFANWKARDDLPAYLYLTNNKDRITLFDGTYLSRPNFPIYNDQIAGSIPLVEGKTYYPISNGVVTALDIKVYKNRLLFFRPKVNTYATTNHNLAPSGTIIEAQVVRYSSEFYTFGTNVTVPFDFVADISGHGGLADAPTPDWIICAEFLRDAIVVYFQKTTWLFRFTGAATGTIFRWDQINSSRNSNAPYGSLDYDGNTTSMGTKGLISCDGVNVDRYDQSIIDQYTDIDNDNFIQCQAVRDDILNQSWMTYPSVERNVGNRFSDKAIIYNFLEENFATYKINLSTVGIENTYQDITWASFAPGSGVWTEGLTWQEANFNWNKFAAQNLAPQVFGGDQNGYVYIMNVTETDNGGHIDVEIKSARWNPFITTGERCRFGYIDFYYEINEDVTLQIDIFGNNSKSPDYTKYLTLNGPANDDYAWKRLFVNLQGEFIRIEITTPFIPQGTINADQAADIPNNGTFLISGIILWAAPAGRLAPGVLI